MIWTKQWGTEEDEKGRDVYIASSNIYVTGFTKVLWTETPIPVNQTSFFHASVQRVKKVDCSERLGGFGMGKPDSCR